MKTYLIAFLLLGVIALAFLPGCKSYRQSKLQDEIEEEVIIPYFEEEEQWYFSVKGHINPGSVENNEMQEMKTDLWWLPGKVNGRIEIVPALKKVGAGNRYKDIHTNEFMDLDEEVYDEYWRNVWYFQIESRTKVVEPLYLPYYFRPRFVYEGDLDQDGVPDFGILMKRQSNLCLYALLTIEDGHWKLLTEPFDVAYNLRASGLELAQKGDRKGEIRITRSSFNDDGLSTFMAAQIVDTVVVAKRIEIGDSL